MTPDALTTTIAQVVTNEHIGPGYWRTRTDDWDLPAVIAQHLTALGWREPLLEVDLTPEQAERLLTAIELSEHLACIDRGTLETVAFDAIWELRTNREATK